MVDSIRLYTDENVARAVVDGLRRRNIDVLTCQAAGMMGATDEEHLAFAMAQQRVIYSQDDDFLRLHAKGVAHAGIVYAHQRVPTSLIIRGLLLIYEVLKPEEMQNHVEFIS
ncbi:MAG: DUF5615 family PIN-like protein [Rudanella sp.]|nr:DUF5615 family PIN-like protein [Rudanella sp.]